MYFVPWFNIFAATKQTHQEQALNRPEDNTRLQIRCFQFRLHFSLVSVHVVQKGLDTSELTVD